MKGKDNISFFNVLQHYYTYIIQEDRKLDKGQIAVYTSLKNDQ